jgi:hypothetical protein
MRQRLRLTVVLAVLTAVLLPASGVEAGTFRRDREERFVGVANVKKLNIVCRRNDDDGRSTVRLKIKVTRKVKGVPNRLVGDDNGWGDRGHIVETFPGGKLVLHRFDTFVAFPKNFEFPTPDKDGDVFKIRLRPFKRFGGRYVPVGRDDGFIFIKLRCVRPAS